MSQPTVPSLSEGYVREPQNILTFLFRHFATANYSQTPTIKSHKTLPYLIYAYGDDIDTLKEEVKASLINFYKGYFDDVIVEVSHKDDYDSIPGNVLLSIAIAVEKDKEIYKLADEFNLNTTEINEDFKNLLRA